MGGMSADKPPAPPAKPAAKADADSKPAAKPAAKPAGPPPALDERPLKFAELAAYAAQLDPVALVASLRDGRGVVRANAALGLAAVNQPAPDLVTLLRDSETKVAAAAAEALGLLGMRVRELIPQITLSLDGAQPEVLDAMVGALAALVGKADDELGVALDVPLALAMKTVVEACGRLDRAGIAFLIQATRHERGRVRINAIGGLARWGKTDIEASIACLNQIEANDPVPDVRTAAKQASLAVLARIKVAAVDALPKNIPDFEDRKLGVSELSEYADQINVDEMVYALRDGRAHVRINGCRAIGVKGAAAAPAVPSLGLACRDSAPQVRTEAAKALGRLGDVALAAAADLVGALSDVEADVADAAAGALEPLGGKVTEALVNGLATGSETGGWRVGELLSKLPDAVERLTEAFRSPAVNVQVNAALGLGMLGKSRVGAGLPPLLGARTGGDARTREAVRRALEMINPSGQAGPSAVQIDGFEDRFLGASEVEASKAELQRIGVADLTAHLQDGRDVVRANAAAGLGALGPAGATAAGALGVRLRDDAPRVRLAAAQALDKLGDDAVMETAGDLVRALGDADEKVAEACAKVIRARKSRMIGALVRGLETDNPTHGRRIGELLGVFDDAAEILCDAFESPAVNVQVNAAIGLGMLGPQRVGKGRKALEGARTGGDARTREAVRKALDMLDGPRNQGPQAIQIEGFEARMLGPEAFASAAGKLPPGDLINYLTDGRAHVRANAATALGTLGPAVAGAAIPIGVLMRDDDMKVRIQAAWALDKLGDDAVREAAVYLVGALRGDADVAKAVAPVLAARKARMLSALLKGLETDDDAHARRILEVINALPDAPEILCDAIESPAENVQVNAAIGIGMLGEKRAGSAGRKALETRRTGGFARTREAVFKALAMWKG
jgi:HEAT repeat protein